MAHYARAPPGAGAPGSDYSFLRESQSKTSTNPGWPQSTHTAGAPPKELTQADVEFLSRMEGDTQGRRRTQYINELSA